MWQVTQAGREAWKARDTAIPEPYRQLLRSIDVEGYTRAVDELLARHPKHLVQDWLHELEELHFIEAGAALGADVAGRAAAVLADTGAYLAERPGRSHARKPAAQTTILIVEDDPDQLALADLRVSAAGYRVRAVGSVAELTAVLERGETPDLLLLDVMLPDGNGFEVLARLRRDERYAPVPIVLLTVVSEQEHIARGLELGADGYVTKPYSKNILVGLIKGVLGDPA
jgi:CheY-like chemotaxis protein